MPSSLKEKAAKGLFWTGLSNGLQQLLQAFFGIFLARLLTQGDYGMVGYLTIFTNVAVALQEAGFRTALINKKDITHADYNSVFWFSLLMGIGLYIILSLSAPLIARFYQNQADLIPLCRYVFLGIIFSSLGTAQGAYLFKNLLIKQQSLAVTIAIAVSGAVGVIMAWNGMAYWGIATQSLLFSFLLTLFCWIFSPWRPTLHIDFRPIRGMFKFSCKILFTNIITQINNNLFSLILGRYYNKKVLGSYTQATKWNDIGHNFITGMVKNVSQPVFVKADIGIDYQKRVFRKMLRFTAFLAFPAMFGLSFIAKEFITIAITTKWLYSAQLLQILCIGGAFIPISNLYYNLIISRGKSNIYMWCTLVLAVIQLATALCLSPYGVVTMIKVYVLINIAWVLVWHYFTWRLIGISLLEALRDTAPFALSAAGSIALVYLCLQPVHNIYLLMPLKIVAVAVLYSLIMKLSHAVVFEECVQYILKKGHHKD
jgi:O-antigen/teichoic acid export membrane protein